MTHQFSVLYSITDIILASYRPRASNISVITHEQNNYIVTSGKIRLIKSNALAFLDNWQTASGADYAINGEFRGGCTLLSGILVTQKNVRQPTTPLTSLPF